MKKVMLLACALFTGVGAFAYRDYGYSGYERKSEELGVFMLIISLALLVLSILFIIRMWKMTTDVRRMRENFIKEEPDIAYLIAIGKQKEAEDAALKHIVDKLYQRYKSGFVRVQTLDLIIENELKKMHLLDIHLPDYVMSGEKFIKKMNELTGKNVQIQ